MRWFLPIPAFVSLCCFGQQPRGLSILEQRCMPCHSGTAKKSGLDLSSRDSAIRGGDRGAAIVPGKSADSLLFRVASHSAEPYMPWQSSKLAEPDLAALAEWIDHGADYGAAKMVTKVTAPAPGAGPLVVPQASAAARAGGGEYGARAKSN